LVLVLGCGAPPPPALTGPKSYAELAPAEVVLIGDLRPTKRIQIAHTSGALPDADGLETALATANQVVSVGGTSTELEVALAGAVCTITHGPRLTNLPDPAIAPELDRHGLNEEEGRSLFATTGVADVRCRTDEGAPGYAGAQAAEVVAKALMRSTRGHLYDPHLDRFWPAAAWESLARRAFSVQRNVRVLREKGADGRVWLGTRGMMAMGRADLEVFPISPEIADALSEKLLTIADAIVNDLRLGAGSTLELGSTEVLLLDRAAYAVTWPKGTTGVEIEAPGETAGRLALTQPRSRLGDRAEAERLARRLSLE